MNEKKEKLQKLITFVEELSRQEGNEWFKEEINRIFLPETVKVGDANISPLFAIGNSVDMIQKYLMLDVVAVIDYSGISNSTVRNQLFRDCIEMSKYRLGKIDNRIDFDEFCRYGHLQAEELVNYFYHQKFDADIQKITAFIKSTNKKYIPPTRSPKSLNHIDYGIKLTTLHIYLKLPSSTKYYLDFINKLRNEISHRNSLQMKAEEETLLEFFSRGFKANEYFDAFNATDSDRDLFFTGKYIQTKKLQEFNLIYEALNNFKDLITDKLSNN